jgi:hypothetical protein
MRIGLQTIGKTDRRVPKDRIRGKVAILCRYFAVCFARETVDAYYHAAKK